MKWTMCHKHASKTVVFQMEQCAKKHMWAISVEVTQFLLFKIHIWHSVKSQWLWEIRNQLPYHRMKIVIFMQCYIKKISFWILCVCIHLYLHFILLIRFFEFCERSAFTLSDARVSPHWWRFVRMPLNIFLCQNEMPWRIWWV